MKECDNSTSKTHISSNFILSICLLIMFDRILFYKKIFGVYSKLCCSVYCLCVNVYCTTATGCQPN